MDRKGNIRSLGRDMLSCRAGLLLQWVTVPLLCHVLMGKFSWLDFVLMVSRMDQAGGAGLLWGGTWPRCPPGTKC